MIEFAVTKNLSDQRLDKVLKKLLREAPDSFIYRMLREKNITLNRKRSEGSVRTKEGDLIQFYLSEETYRKMRGQEKGAGVQTLSAGKPSKDRDPEPVVLYEDRDVLIFLKPAGLRSQKSAPSDRSANDWVLERFSQHPEAAANDGFRPSVVNRLDRNTGGIMAAGMSAEGLRVLSELFRERSLKKLYYAVVSGEAPEKMDARAWIRKSPDGNLSIVSSSEVPESLPIETDWVRIAYDPVRNISLLDVDLRTGRRHQIRAHLSFLGYPILGDPKYGDPQVNRKFGLPYQCLYCHHLEFPECSLPALSGRIFSVPLPLNWPIRPEGGHS